MSPWRISDLSLLQQHPPSLYIPKPNLSRSVYSDHILVILIVFLNAPPSASTQASLLIQVRIDRTLRIAFRPFLLLGLLPSPSWLNTIALLVLRTRHEPCHHIQDEMDVQGASIRRVFRKLVKSAVLPLPIANYSTATSNYPRRGPRKTTKSFSAHTIKSKFDQPDI